MPENAYEKAKEDALKCLDRRMYSRAQLLDKLKQRGHDLQAGNQALDRLEELGLVNDAEFGKALIREQTSRKPAGERLLRQKLFQKGLKQQLIDKLLAEWRNNPQNDPYADALTLAQNKLKSFNKTLEPIKRKRRLQSLLARRGFDWDVVSQVLEELRIKN